MKIRKCFVSNSSSSSFTCDICGEVYGGWDISLEDAGMYECKNGHTFCGQHKDDLDLDLLKNLVRQNEHINKHIDEETKQAIDNMSKDEIFDLLEDYDINDRYEYPEEFCPLCNFKHIANRDKLLYVIKLTGLTQEQITEQMARFETYGQFKSYLNGELQQNIDSIIERLGVD